MNLIRPKDRIGRTDTDLLNLTALLNSATLSPKIGVVQLLGDRLTVGRVALDHLIGVRIPVSQPTLPPHPESSPIAFHAKLTSALITGNPDEGSTFVTTPLLQKQSENRRSLELFDLFRLNLRNSPPRIASPHEPWKTHCMRLGRAGDCYGSDCGCSGGGTPCRRPPLSDASIMISVAPFRARWSWYG